jgi:hypothetical protein
LLNRWQRLLRPGIINLPIIGTAESFRWGVWGSLSRENFERLLMMDDDPGCVDLPPMFSWLSSQISEYPDTLNLKMFAHIQEPETARIFASNAPTIHFSRITPRHRSRASKGKPAPQAPSDRGVTSVLIPQPHERTPTQPS